MQRTHIVRLNAFLQAQKISLTEAQQEQVIAKVSEELTGGVAALKNAAHAVRALLTAWGFPLKQSLAFEGLAQLLGERDWNTLRARAEDVSYVPGETLTVCYEYVQVSSHFFARYAYRVMAKPDGVESIQDGLANLSKFLVPGVRVRLISEVSLEVESVLRDWQSAEKKTAPLFTGLRDSRKAFFTEAVLKGFVARRKGVSKQLDVAAPRVFTHFIVIEAPYELLAEEKGTPSKGRMSKMARHIQKLLGETLGLELAPVSLKRLEGLTDCGRRPDGQVMQWGILPLVERPASDISAVWGPLPVSSQAFADFSFERGVLGTRPEVALKDFGWIVPNAVAALPNVMEQINRKANESRYELSAKIEDPLSWNRLLETFPIKKPVLKGREGGLPLLSQEGALNMFDIWENPRAASFVIAAASGAGKTFVAKELVVDTLARTGRVRILDAGRSYHGFCHLLDGQNVVFDCDSPQSVNPLSGARDELEYNQRKEAWLTFLTELSRAFDARDQACLSVALDIAWKYAREALSPRHVLVALGYDASIEAITLGKRLQESLTIAGPWLSGQGVAHLNEDLVVFELEGVWRNPELKTLVAQALLCQFTQEMAQNDGVKKHLYLIDEAEFLLKPLSQNSAKHLVEYAEIFRASIGLVAQGFEDYASSEFLQHMFEQAPTQIFMYQRPEQLMLLTEKQPGYWRMEEALRTVRSGQGFAGLGIVQKQTLQGVFRSVIEDLSYYLYSEHPTEVQNRQALLQKGYSVLESLEILSLADAGKPGAKGP